MKQYVQKPNCEAVVLDNEWMILHTEAYTITKMNAVGGYIWTLLNSAQTVASLTESIADKYGNPGDSVEQDIQAFLSELMGCGLIEYAN